MSLFFRFALVAIGGLLLGTACAILMSPPLSFIAAFIAGGVWGFGAMATTA